MISIDIQKILITGGAGYIGKNLIKKLLLEGITVYALVRPSTDISIFEGSGDNFYILEWDGTLDGMLGIVAEAKPQAVIHLASLFLVQHKAQDIVPLIQSNITLGTALLEACAQNGVKFFVNTATHWQHYNLEDYNPVNLYAATKQSFEDIMRYYTEACGIKALTVKIIDTYGPFDTRGKVATLFKRIALSGEILEMSPGSQELGLLYIDDAVKAFMIALQEVQKTEKYNSKIAAPKRLYTLREVAAIFEAVSEKKLNILWGAKEYRPREMMKVWNCEENILSGQELIDLPEGLAKMITAEKTGEDSNGI